MLFVCHKSMAGCLSAEDKIWSAQIWSGFLLDAKIAISFTLSKNITYRSKTSWRHRENILTCCIFNVPPDWFEFNCGIVTLKAANKNNRGCRALLGRVVIHSFTRPRLPIKIFFKYSGIPLYGHPLNTDILISLKISFVPTKSSYFVYKIPQLVTISGTSLTQLYGQ